MNCFEYVELICLFVIWYVYLDKIVFVLCEKIVEVCVQGIECIFVGYVECGMCGEIDWICVDEGIECIVGLYCYVFYIGVDKFFVECVDEIIVFYFMDLIVCQFEVFVIELFKFDKYFEFIQMVFGNYEKIVYLVQMEDEELQVKVKWVVDFFGLVYEYCFIGYGDFIFVFMGVVKVQV